MERFAKIQDSLDSVLDKSVHEQRLVGGVLLVHEDGLPRYERAFGFIDAGRVHRTELNTIFRLASLTKPLVTAAAMRLIELGFITLDEPVTRWIPNFKPKMADGSSPVITMRHLLTHTAGLSYRFSEPNTSAYHEYDISDGFDDIMISAFDSLERLAKAPLLYQPGTSWKYSLATDVVGAIIAKVAQTSLAKVVKELVTGPLDMRDTAFDLVDRSRLSIAFQDSSPCPIPIREGLPVASPEGNFRLSPSRAFSRTHYASGGAGMSGTAPDFMAFLEALRRGGSPILQASSVLAMRTLHIEKNAECLGPGWGFGYGCAVLEDPLLARTPQARGTIQWGGVYGNTWFFDPAAHLCVVSFTNTTPEGVHGAFPHDVLRAIYSA